MRKSFEGLAATMPGNAAQPEPGVSPLPQAFDLSPEVVPGYVAPTFDVQDWPEEANVLLIEAAGAVGKSATAAALAYELNWPLVHAERAQVGSYSLSGLIQDSLGMTSDYMAHLSRGDAGIVIDSLDEAHLRAGTENFLAFLDNVQKIAGVTRDGSSRPSIVLFSRTDTAQYVRWSFENAKLPLAEARLNFFDFAAAKRFIESYMIQRYQETERSEYNVFRGNPGPYNKLRDERLRQVARVLLRRDEVNLNSDWHEVEDFLGYAPVLIAMVESLAVRNPAAAKNLHLHSQEQSHLLVEILENILTREQSKFTDHTGPKLRAIQPAESSAEFSAEQLYTPHEQCIRVAAYSANIELISVFPPALPMELRGTYEEARATWLPDHPFLRGGTFASVVFSDFVWASISQDPSSQVALQCSPHTLIGDVGPFFARFLAHQRNSASGETAISEDLVEKVIHSWTQESELVSSADNEIELVLTEDHSLLQCSRQTSQSDGAEDVKGLTFQVTDVSGALACSAPLKNTTIITDQGIILGTRGQHLLLGPECIIMAAETVIDAETLRVETEGGRRGGIALVAPVLTANHLAKVEASRETLYIYAPEPPPKLRPFLRTLGAGFAANIPFKLFVDLRNILTSFKPSRKGARVLATMFEQRVLRGDASRVQIFRELQRRGLIDREDAWYYLNLAGLQRLGFGLVDLKVGEPSTAVLDFLRTVTSLEEDSE